MQINYNTIKSLDKKSGGDFYIFKKNVFIKNIDEFNNSFQKYYQNFKIGYSYKTNYIPHVCKVANELGIYAEIVSELELNIARKIGVNPEKIIYNGPEKTEESLEYCLLNGSYINIDNLTELKKVVEIIDKYPQRTFSIGIRLNFDFKDNFFSRFGFANNSKEINEALEIFSKYKDRLKLIGLHTHSTRPDKSPEIYLRKLEALIRFSESVNNKADLKYLDIGGGFYGYMSDFIKSQFEQPVFEIEDYQIVAKEMKKRFPKENVSLIIEPGVALTANILDYFVRVTNVRNIFGRNIALTNGSFHNIKPSGHKKKLGIQVFSRHLNKDKNSNKFDIVGYTCLENDYLDNGYSGNLKEGDYIRFKNVGAYTIVFKPPFIKLAPPIYLIKDNTIETIRKREEFTDSFRAYSF